MTERGCGALAEGEKLEGKSEMRKAREIYERTQAVRDARKRLCKVCTKCNRCSFMKNRARKPHAAPGSVHVLEKSREV